MRPLAPSPTSLRPALALAVVSALLAGCADVHRGVEAVGRVGTPAAAPVAEVEALPPGRPDIKTVRPRGAPRAPATDASAAEPDRTVSAPVVSEAAVPSPQQIFDFHPAGAKPDSWRQPFVIDTSDGPLAADVRRSAAELKAFNADQKAGAIRTAAVHKPCGEMDVAAAKPGCAAPPPKP